MSASQKTMTYTFTLHPVERCLPLSRTKLLSEVIVDQLYGGITNVWHHPGHVFVTTDGGKKLFTFDCKPVHPQHGISSSSLDVQNCAFSIIDVILISSTLALVVERNGHTQWWRYTKGFDWQSVGNMELCNLVNSNVTSITYLPLSKTLIWCERNEKPTSDVSETSILPDDSRSTFCIKGKTLSNTTDLSAQNLRELEVHPSFTLINNCPDCDVYGVASDKLFIRTKVDKDQITVSFVCNVDLDDVSMFLGREKFDVSSSSHNNSLDFGSLLLTFLPSIVKADANYGDLGVKVDDHRVVALSSCGVIEVFNFKESPNAKLDHHIITLSLDDSTLQYGHWFLHNKYIGIIHHQNLCLYSLHDGTCICQWMSEDLSDITAVLPSSSPSFLAWVISPKGMMAIQATDSKLKTAFTSPDNLPDDELLQTAVLQLTHLHEKKHQGYDKGVSDKLDKLQKAWTDGKGSHQSQIVEMLEPIIDEYWRLDKMSNALLDTKELSQENSERDVTDQFTEELSKIATLSRRARDSRLLWLSQIYPERLLNNLCDGITLNCEEVIESEMPKWQTLLGIEGWDLARFELVCRLLFQLHPEKLCHFVKCAESVSEQTVGVSAFIRKKHSLVFYRSASECLPLAETSCNPSVAAAAQGKLIIASEKENCVEQALKHLLLHKLWQDAIDLVKAHATNQEQLPCYLFITMSTLAENHALSEFIPQIFKLMPSWKSFLSFSQLASMQPDIRQHQLSNSASDLFCHEDSDMNFGAIKPFLTDLIKKMDAT